MTSRTVFGYSNDSDQITVIAASRPDVPTLATSSNDNGAAEFVWNIPSNGGSPITAYQVLIRHSDGINFSEDTTNCDGSDSVTVSAATCSVPNSVLLTSPFSLSYGDDVFFKVLATNLVGSSDYSTLGNAGTLFTVPGAPLSLTSNAASTTQTQVGLSWYEGLSDGGDDVIDYRLWVKIEDGAYAVLADSLTSTIYTATGLTSGTTYEFKVQARNDAGYGAFSSAVTELTAERPSKPSAPTTSLAGEFVMISWTEPETNGAPITAYTISIR